MQQQQEGDAGHERETEQHSSLPARHEVAHAPQQQQQQPQEQHKHTATAGASHRSIEPGTIYRWGWLAVHFCCALTTAH